MSTRNEKKPLWQSVYELFPITNRLLLVKRLGPKVVYTLSRRTRSFRFFHCFTKHSFRQIWPWAVFKDCILGIFVVWKKLVLVKRRAVDQRVCLSTIEQAEPAELTIQVNAASISFQSVLLTIQTSFSLVSESMMRFIILDNNGILFKQEKSEILENIIKVGCWIELFCDVYYSFISQSLALRAVFRISF